MTAAPPTPAAGPSPDPRLPGLYVAASAASAAGQAAYTRLYLVNLALLVLGAVFTSLSPDDLRQRQVVAVLAACAFVCALFVSSALRLTRAQRTWFYGRALAEAVKSAAWQYMMRAGRFGPPAYDAAVRDRFLDELEYLRRQARALRADLDDAGRPPITLYMDDVRGRPAADRARLYAADRLDDQRRWYTDRAAQNHRQANRLVWAVLAAELVATLLAVLQVLKPDLPLNSASVLASVAAAFLAWLHLNQHEQLALAYANTQQELASLAPRFPTAADDAVLARLVARVEDAISREHRIWKARRDVELHESEGADGPGAGTS